MQHVMLNFSFVCDYHLGVGKGLLVFVYFFFYVTEQIKYCLCLSANVCRLSLIITP